MKAKRLYHSLRLACIRTTTKRAAYIKRHDLLNGIGEKCQWGPWFLPPYPKLIRIHNNVNIHKTAKLVPHDVINWFLKKGHPDIDFGHFERVGCIEIMDNVYVAMNSIILPNVRINKNCIVTAGSVVTNDIPENSIVAGNPAQVIGRFDQYVAIRMMTRDENIRFKNQDLPAELATEKWKQFDAARVNESKPESNFEEEHILSAIEKDIRDKIIAVLSEEIGGVDLNVENRLIDNHVLDSLSMMSIVSLLEENFKCTIPFNEINASNFNSTTGMAKLIAKVSSGVVECSNENVVSEAASSLQPLSLNITETEKSVVQRIMEFSLINPDKPAIIANDKTTSYRELASMIFSIRNWLINSGNGLTKRKTYLGGGLQDCCIVVQAVHEDTCIACYYAVHLIGAKLVPVEKTASKERILDIAHETGSVLVIGLEKFEGSDIAWIDYEAIRSISHTDDFNIESSVTYPGIDTPCEMVFTTGTTGKSKGVLMTHRHISWYSYSIAECVEMKAGNRFLLTTPLNHAGGLRRTHLSLANGCCMVYLDGLSDLGKYFEYIQKYHVTSLYLPPVAVRILLSRTGDELAKYKNQIDFVYSSSSALPDGDCQELRRLLPNTRLYNAYEASETPGVSAYNYNVEQPLKNCLGQANDGVELAVLLEDGSINKEPEIQGQICVKSKMNMAGYYNEPELSASVLKDGWFVSNDLGYLDRSGNIYYNGRKGDVINIGGYKIAPTDVEEVALASGLINECICIEDFDEYQVPFLKLLVVVDNEEVLDERKLTAFISSKLEAYKVPRRIECVESIKKTFNGKIDRKAYRGGK